MSNVRGGATVYLAEGRFLVHSENRTQSRVWITAPPYLELPVDASDAALGQMVRQALFASRDGVADPPANSDEAELVRPFLEAVGLTNVKAILRIPWVSISRDGWRVRVYATRGRQFTGEAAEAAIESDADIGKAVRGALRL